MTRVWCVVVTLALADLTYRFVEGPFRTLGFRAVGARMRDQVARLSVPTRRGVAALVTVVALVVAGIVVTAPDQSETARMLAANEAAAEADEPTAPTPGSAVNASPSAAPSSVGSAGPSGVPTGRNATFTMPAGRTSTPTVTRSWSAASPRCATTSPASGSTPSPTDGGPTR